MLPTAGISATSLLPWSPGTKATEDLLPTHIRVPGPLLSPGPTHPAAHSSPRLAKQLGLPQPTRATLGTSFTWVPLDQVGDGGTEGAAQSKGHTADPSLSRTQEHAQPHPGRSWSPGPPVTTSSHELSPVLPEGSVSPWLSLLATQGASPRPPCSPTPRTPTGTPSVATIGYSQEGTPHLLPTAQRPGPRHKRQATPLPTESPCTAQL